LTATGTFGFFAFDNVPPGNYTISVAAGRYSFSPMNIQVSGNVTGISFTAPSQ